MTNVARNLNREKSATQYIKDEFYKAAGRVGGEMRKIQKQPLNNCTKIVVGELNDSIGKDCQYINGQCQA